MVIFDQLRISDDGNRMYINIHVNRADYFKDRYLDYMIIKTAKQVSETEISPSTSDGENVYILTFDGNLKEADIVLQPNDFNLNFAKNNFSADLFFVYVVCKEVKADPCTPCPLAELTTLGVTFDEVLLYQKVMQFTRELNQDCEIPQNLLDLILLWYGFKAAIETEHYTVAIDFWKRLFGGKNTIVTSKGCGCHG